MEELLETLRDERKFHQLIREVTLRISKLAFPDSDIDDWDDHLGYAVNIWLGDDELIATIYANMPDNNVDYQNFVTFLTIQTKI